MGNVISSVRVTQRIANDNSFSIFTTILLENAPQLGVQAILIFKLGITGTIVLISFSSSIFNIFMSILLSLVHYVLYRGQSDTKWTILLSWNGRSQGYGAAPFAPSGKSSNADQRVSLNPLIKMGRRKSLAKELATIQFAGSGGVSFEVLAETAQLDACLIHGVLQYETTQS